MIRVGRNQEAKGNEIMRRMVMMVMVAAFFVALSAGTALAESDPAIRGTNAGDALYGTSIADTIYGFGGADLIYGYGGADTLYGGNESGWGDKILGGGANDRILGQAGDDALYGQAGNDVMNGGYGNDLIVGGYGSDLLNGGPGFDQVNAQDGQKDTIVVCGNENDKIYYDRGLDVLRYCEASTSGVMMMTASEATTAGTANLSTQEPPKGLFENTGKVLVEHKGKERCVPEKNLEGHLEHGDEIINPSGCSSAEQGRR